MLGVLFRLVYVQVEILLSFFALMLFVAYVQAMNRRKWEAEEAHMNNTADM